MLYTKWISTRIDRATLLDLAYLKKPVLHRFNLYTKERRYFGVGLFGMGRENGTA